MQAYSILKDKFPEGVTLDLAARSAGLKVEYRPYGHDREYRAKLLRAVYAHETGREPETRFDSGLGKAQWEYGVRGTDYWTKDKREAVLAYMGAV